MKPFTFIDLKSVIAHEWGHYLAFHLLGYGQKNEGIVIKSSMWGLDGHTSNFGVLSCEEQLIVLYSGVVSEGLFCGRTIRIGGTDKEKAQRIAPDKRMREMARQKAVHLLAPYPKVIATLVSLTAQRYGDRREMDLFSFYDRIFRDEASQYLELALSSVEDVGNREII